MQDNLYILVNAAREANISDIIAIILMGSVFGVVFGAMVYRRKSILLFSVVCGIVYIPFGLLVRAMNSGHWIKVWLENFFKAFSNIELNFQLFFLKQQ